MKEQKQLFLFFSAACLVEKFLIFQILNKMINLSQEELFAIYLSPFEFGSLAIFLFAITSISQVTSGPIQLAIMRLSNEAYELGEINYLYLSTIKIFKRQLFFIFISSILINLILKILFNIKFHIVYLLFLIFNLFGSGITDIKYSLFGGLRDRKSQIIISLCEILIKPTILFLFFLIFNTKISEYFFFS